MRDLLQFDSADPNAEATDRLMLGICAGIWLVWLIVSAVAAVALFNLGRGNSAAQDSPWLLYTVIAVSAVVVVGSIPLLLKARRVALESRDASPGGQHQLKNATGAPAPVAPAVDAPTEKLRVFGTAVDLSQASPSGRHAQHEAPAAAGDAGADRWWLRATTALFSTMGLALVAVSTATYLLASGTDIGAWVALGVAGLITAAMPAVALAFERLLAGSAAVEQSATG